MLRFLRRLYYSGETATYRKSTDQAFRWWAKWAGLRPDTPPEMVVDWFLDQGQPEFAEIVHDYIRFSKFLDRRLLGA